MHRTGENFKRIGPAHETSTYRICVNLHAQLASGVRGLYFVCVFIYFYTLAMRAAKALASLCICTDSPEPSPLDSAISTKLIAYA